MGMLEDEIEDAEFNIEDYEEQARRSNLRAVDFQAIADDMTQPVTRREKFAIYAQQERAYVDAAKRNAWKEQKKLEDLRLEQKLAQEDARAELMRVTGLPEFPSLRGVEA